MFCVVGGARFIIFIVCIWFFIIEVRCFLVFVDYGFVG